MSMQPPKWVDRFLQWYCNPDLLEEIQGDAYELYLERVKKEGKRSADLKYAWDVFRFFRWSNIKRTGNESEIGRQHALWNFNFKMALRNAGRNKLVFIVKITGLSICMAFVLLLTAFVVNELTFDQFHTNHNRLYRVTSRVSFQDQITHYAVTPLPIGQALQEGIPEIEDHFRFMYQEKPIFHIEDEIFYNEVTLSVDSNFLKILTFDFLQGNDQALNGPDKIVLTETLAAKFFGDQDPLGNTIKYGGVENLLEVVAVIKDMPSNSHLKFDALISWETFDHYDDWGNLNAYTYILLRPGVNVKEIKNKMTPVLTGFHELVAREYKATYEPILERITDIHFSERLDEDIVEKRNRSSLLIMLAVIVLFLITGFINYLNLTLAELTANLKKMGILRVFGGMTGSHNRMLLTDTLFTLSNVLPLTLILCYGGWTFSDSYLSIQVDRDVLASPLFMAMTGAFLALLIASSRLNSYFLSKASHVVNLLKGKLSTKESGLYARKVLVAAQLSFSIIMIALIIIIVDQFHFIQESDKGFSDKNIVVVKLRSGNHSQVEGFNEAIRALGGVARVDGSSYYPGIIETKYVFRVEKESGMEQLLVPMMFCGRDYFDALGVEIVKGRGFENDRTEDRFGSFIINETAALEFGWKDPVGKRIDGPLSGQNEAYHEGEVIGVVRDFNFASLHSKIEPLLIFLKDDNWIARFIYIKTDPIHPPDLIPAIEKTYKAQWPEYPFEWEYLDTKYLSLYEKDHQVKSIFEIGLVISILISCLGIFSISSLLAALRTREMGIRKVVGASAVQLFFLHGKSFLQFLLISMVVAWPVIWFLSVKWLQSFAYHVDLNIGYFIIPGIIALFITIITSGYHGIKGALVNPIDILKHE